MGEGGTNSAASFGLHIYPLKQIFKHESILADLSTTFVTCHHTNIAKLEQFSVYMIATKYSACIQYFVISQS